jgi:hypothetical protein
MADLQRNLPSNNKKKKISLWKACLYLNNLRRRLMFVGQIGSVFQINNESDKSDESNESNESDVNNKNDK